MSKLYSRQIGETARNLLTPGACGQVLAGFSRAAYLVTEQEGLFWLTPENAPMHPRGLQVTGPFPKILAEDNFFIEDQRINIAPDLQVNFADASTWVISPITNNAALEINQIPTRVKTFLSDVFDLSQASGFGQLIPKIFSLAAGRLDNEPEIAPVLALAWMSISEIVKACLTCDMSGLLQKANALVGLGEGLTPSGDDFLGGLLFCLNSIQRLYPSFINLDSCQQALFIESAKQRTNLISFTLLKDLANCQAIEPLHKFIQAIFSDQPLESIRQSATCLIQIGHSTGWDLLTGTLTGLLLCFRSPDLIDSSSILLEQNIYA